MKIPMLKRLMSKVSHDLSTDCWNWKGAKSRNRSGVPYGRIGNERAHRISFNIFNGNIPDRLTIHHKCENTLCVNPFHLSAIPLIENILLGNGFTAINARKTQCPKGHLLNGNKFENGRKRRYCLECKKVWNKQWKETKKENAMSKNRYSGCAMHTDRNDGVMKSHPTR